MTKVLKYDYINSLLFNFLTLFLEFSGIFYPKFYALFTDVYVLETV